jgi:hypothetical protein
MDDPKSKNGGENHAKVFLSARYFSSLILQKFTAGQPWLSLT